MRAENLKEKLKSLKVSQVKFAALCGVSEVQVSKWANGHADVPEYASTILKLIESAESNSAIEQLTSLASVVSDGHFTICKFTTNYRVGLGTPADRDSIDRMVAGNTIKEAIDNLLSKVRDVGYM